MSNMSIGVRFGDSLLTPVQIMENSGGVTNARVGPGCRGL